MIDADYVSLAAGRAWTCVIEQLDTRITELLVTPTERTDGDSAVYGHSQVIGSWRDREINLTLRYTRHTDSRFEAIDCSAAWIAGQCAHARTFPLWVHLQTTETIEDRVDALFGIIQHQWSLM